MYAPACFQQQICQRNRYQISELYVRLFRGAYGLNSLFTDNKFYPYWASPVDEFLESEDIERIPAGPAKSSDSNQIQNLQDDLRRVITNRHSPLRDANVLMTALLEKWSLILQTVVNKVIASIKTLCDMCV